MRSEQLQKRDEVCAEIEIVRGHALGVHAFQQLQAQRVVALRTHADGVTCGEVVVDEPRVARCLRKN